MQPIIGVTSGRRMVTSTKGETRATVLYTTYTNMVRHAGGMPVVLTPGPADEASSIIARLDGLILSGGGDVAPSIYGGVAHEAVYEVDPLRDEYELALARAAHDRRLPMLAICRGMQVANVAFGGTLIEDIPSESASALEHQIGGPGTVTPHHVVKIAPGSAVAAAVGTETPNVNTIHHQALRVVADVFRLVGEAPDGIAEAIESADDEWPMWGVQWHPEYLGQHDGPSLRLFETLVDAATKAMTP
jgi:putative glutamine amidotransferase